MSENQNTPLEEIKNQKKQALQNEKSPVLSSENNEEISLESSKETSNIEEVEAVNTDAKETVLNDKKVDDLGVVEEKKSKKAPSKKEKDIEKEASPVENLNIEKENEVEVKEENLSEDKVSVNENTTTTTDKEVENPEPQVEESKSEKKKEEKEEEEEETPKAKIEAKDYSLLSNAELIEELNQLLKNNKVQNIKNQVEDLKNVFNENFNKELTEQKEAFLEQGGNIIDFYFSTPLKKDFNALYFDYKEKRNNYYKSLQKDYHANLSKRLELIEELKGLLNAEENINTTYNHFKKIQERWRDAGAIPRDRYNTVWNTYHHHVENFYDFLHLNREFRDLDFKHNLEQKLKLINRVEELAQSLDINKSFRELQMIHRMWKEEIGPVAKQYREDVWKRFSDATKIIHEKRQEALTESEKSFHENYEVKKTLIEQINTLTTTVKPTHQNWQKAIKECQVIRDKFFNTGKVPLKNNQEIWKQFKNEVSNFNKQKNIFYKSLKKEQYQNLEGKKALIKIAEDNKDHEDFDQTTALMKKIQNDWKQIGHVPRKDSDKIWKQFKQACNHYFDRLHSDKNESNKVEIEAYEQKKAFIDSLKDFELSDDQNTDLETIKTKISSWKTIGRVPENKRFIEGKFNKVLDSLFNKLNLDKKEIEMIKFENKLESFSSQNDSKKLANERYYLSKKIEEVSQVIIQLENNLGFFQHVDDDNPLVQDVHKKIDAQKESLELLKSKLKKINSFM